MVRHPTGLLFQLAAVGGLLVVAAAFTAESGTATNPYCFTCTDEDALVQPCLGTAQGSPDYTWHEDDPEETWQGNVYGTPHAPVHCVGNSHGNQCADSPGGHGNECLARLQDIEALQMALGQRNFKALAAIVMAETGYVRFNASRGSIQTTSCDREFTDANIPLSEGDLGGLRRALSALELRRATESD